MGLPKEEADSHVEELLRRHGLTVLKFYEIEDVLLAKDMVTLVGYCLLVHLLSGIVLHFRYVLYPSRIRSASAAAFAADEAGAAEQCVAR